MYFLLLWSRDLLGFSEFSHEILSFSFLVLGGVVFQVFFELNCCGCTVVCESSKHRLSIPLVEVLNGPIDDNKERCGYSRVLDLRTSHLKVTMSTHTHIECCAA